MIEQNLCKEGDVIKFYDNLYFSASSWNRKRATTTHIVYAVYLGIQDFGRELKCYVLCSSSRKTGLQGLSTLCLAYGVGANEKRFIDENI